MKTCWTGFVVRGIVTQDEFSCLPLYVLNGSNVFNMLWSPDSRIVSELGPNK